MAKKSGKGNGKAKSTSTTGKPTRAVDRPEVRAQVDALLATCGADVGTRDGRLVRDLVITSLKLPTDGRHTGELKMLTASLKEFRHAMRVFGEHPESRRVSIFGSARTPEHHGDYAAALDFAELMAALGWVSITGAGDGIMKAGQEGTGPDASFGLAIRLPFEQSTNEVIAGDPKLITFKYFFTRKTMFLSQSHAVVALPGGFGTQDELMESLTLIQTGKSVMVPVVLLAGTGSNYWQRWDRYVRDELLAGDFISPEDTNLYYLADTPTAAAEHIIAFYSTYHSSRYVGDDFVIRLRRPLRPHQIDALDDEFAPLVAEGRITQREAYPAEGEYLDLPRVAFTHTRRQQGLVRVLIDRINEYGGAATPTP